MFKPTRSRLSSAVLAMRAKLLSLLVLLVAVATMAGWSLGIPPLVTWGGDVTMKFSTALCLILTSAMIWAMSDRKSGHGWRTTVVSAAAFWILFSVGVLLLSHISGANFTLEQIFRPTAYVDFQEVGKDSMGAGYPSIACLAGLLFVSLGGLVEVWNTHRKYARLRWIGGLVAALGIAALVGHYFRSPAIFNTGLALNTSVCFLLIGWAFWIRGHRAPRG